MSARNLLLLCALALGGCATTNAPDGFLRTPRDQQDEAYGGWVEIHYRVPMPDGERIKRTASGELIGLASDTLYVLPAYAASVAVPLSRSDISTVTLTAYNAETGKLAAWTAFGTLSTITHGFALILTAPLWALFGGSAAALHSYQPRHTYTTDPLSLSSGSNGEWYELGHYARFPAGMPRELIGRPLAKKNNRY